MAQVLESQHSPSCCAFFFLNCARYRAHAHTHTHASRAHTPRTNARAHTHTHTHRWQTCFSLFWSTSCPHTTTYVSSYYYICVLILLSTGGKRAFCYFGLQPVRAGARAGCLRQVAQPHWYFTTAICVSSYH